MAITSFNHISNRWFINFGINVSISESDRTKIIKNQCFPYYIIKWSVGSKYFQVLMEPKVKRVIKSVDFPLFKTLDYYEEDKEVMERELTFYIKSSIGE